MKVLNVEEVSPTKRKLTLQIEPTDLEVEREEAYGELEKEAVLPGFRKGHVPRKFLELRFDKTIRKEAFGDAVNKALVDATKEREMQAVGQPVFDPPDLNELAEKAVSEPVDLSATVEVIPPFELPQYTGLKLPVETLTIGEQMVNEVIESERERAAYYVAVDDRPAKEGDFLVIDVSTTRGEEPFGGLTHSRFMVPMLGNSGNPKGFDDGLLNHRKGERFEFDFEVGSDHPFYTPDGTNTFHVKARIQQISERILPELDDEFAKDLGYESMESYRMTITSRMQFNQAMVLSRSRRNAIVNYLLENTELSVPASIIQMDYMKLKYERESQMAERGEGERFLSAEEQSELEINTMFRAEQESKRKLILGKIAEKESITVTDDDYFSFMESVARARNEKNVDRFLAEVERKGLEDVYRENLLRNKVIEWLLDKNEFEVKETDTPSEKILDDIEEELGGEEEQEKD